MVKSLFARLAGKKQDAEENELRPDITRVIAGWENRDRRASDQPNLHSEQNDAEADTPEQIRDWLRSDLDRLTETMAAALAEPQDGEARVAFESAIHNLFGASGAYGGGALTRLSGSLQRLVSNTEHLNEIAALINLHVKACLAAARSGSDSRAIAVSDAVCNALEAQVAAKLDTPTNDQTEFYEAG